MNIKQGEESIVRHLTFLISCFCLVIFLTNIEGCQSSRRSNPVVEMESNSKDSSAEKRKICEGSKVELVNRAEWDARPPKDKSLITGPVGMVFIHHTAGKWECYNKEECIRNTKSIQNFHMDERGWSDIGYSFLIGEDGRVYEGRGWGVVGAHTLHYNSIAYGFSVIGNFASKLPNEKALKAVKEIIKCGVKKGYIKPDYEMFGHRDGGCTECPGEEFYQLIQTWPHYSHRNITKSC